MVVAASCAHHAGCIHLGSEPRDRRLVSEAPVGTAAIVVLQPDGESPSSLGGAAVGAPVGPLVQEGLDESLCLAVGLRSVEAREDVPLDLVVLESILSIPGMV